LFELHDKELPFCCEVRIANLKDRTTMDRILVERDSQKVIVIGKNGTQIKEIGTLARTKLEEFLQCKVYLELNEKSRQGLASNNDSRSLAICPDRWHGMLSHPLLNKTKMMFRSIKKLALSTCVFFWCAWIL
jgi:KH domain